MAHHRKALAAAAALNTAVVAVELVAGWEAGSLLVLWQAVERLLDPLPVLTWVPVVVGLGAAAANWAIARLLWQPGRHNAAIRLAYLHNLGDAFASLAPVLAGVLVGVSGYSFFDPLVAGVIAAWIMVSTAREAFGTRVELIWPQKIQCGHAESD